MHSHPSLESQGSPNIVNLLAILHQSHGSNHNTFGASALIAVLFNQGGSLFAAQRSKDVMYLTVTFETFSTVAFGRLPV